MRNPNDVKFVVEQTATTFVTKYGYNSGSGCFPMDLECMRELYGASAVSTVHEHGRDWIVVTQYTNGQASDRPYKTDTF